MQRRKTSFISTPSANTVGDLGKPLSQRKLLSQYVEIQKPKYCVSIRNRRYILKNDSIDNIAERQVKVFSVEETGTI